jgi:hypothetical protein
MHAWPGYCASYLIYGTIYTCCISFLYLEIVSWKPEKNNDGVCFQISGNLKLNNTPLLLVNYHCLYSFFLQVFCL